ncbi:MAG: hypothetical protein AVDCRST_MAG73-8 [uncultured Thermomicrobiales bacterium]|uniref:Uncharacterized protein n=1 Tax=uncultured Thermomicrobiales bacterium TaxID=1645740 RepID=A0A6J4TB05_9BACT|nr:MAG: hypothetical protein AVDCRST_MAG73-8 [uncultured Thermomicrobiales bacterium]
MTPGPAASGHAGVSARGATGRPVRIVVGLAILLGVCVVHRYALFFFGVDLGA